MTRTGQDSFQTRKTLSIEGKAYDYFSLHDAAQKLGDISRLPHTLKILLENLLRYEDGRSVTKEDVQALVDWQKEKRSNHEIAYRPARVLMQDFTGVPAVVDLAAMRDAIAKLGGDPEKINPLSAVDLVIDHSVMVDEFGTPMAFQVNVEREFERNFERYQFLKWGQQAFKNFRVVPPGTGICHQVNLEYLGQTVWVEDDENTGNPIAYPDTLVGTDSHTTMVNGLAILGWGVGGIEAEAAMLGQPVSMVIPEVIGFKLTGALKEGATATDLVLTVTEMLREKGVVGKFVEFYGDGIASMTLPDRATLGNMSPEFGSTCAYFPIDEETIRYLKFSGRDEARVKLVEAYAREQGLWCDAATPDPEFTDTLELDLGDVEPCIAGPKRPQDRVLLKEAAGAFREVLGHGAKDVSDQRKAVLTEEAGMEEVTPSHGPSHTTLTSSPYGEVEASLPSPLREREGPGEASRSREGEGHGLDANYALRHGDVVIAAITSCTNTSNPSVMLGAGLLARNALKKGLKVKPWVKTSLAPGSQVVTDYLAKAGLQDDLDALGFNLVGYGCTTCIGNSGPLPEKIAQAITERDLNVCGVLSGNRNFEGRINPHVKSNYLASPPLVVAYALAGSMLVDLLNDPLGQDAEGNDVYLKDIWPGSDEIKDTIASSITPEMFVARYSNVFEGTKEWRDIDSGAGQTYQWEEESTYVKNPPYFEGMSLELDAPEDVRDARCLALLGDSVTTDHISPAGAIKTDSPAGAYLIGKGVEPREFNSYGARRGNHEVMMRGTFANIRIRNEMAPGTEGGVTLYLPGGETMPIFDAAMAYMKENRPLIVIAGKEYGTGSSRDWAAKGTRLLGVRAVIAESFERIHRSNLIGMGVLPLQFTGGQTRGSLNLTGRETFSVSGVTDLKPRAELKLTIIREDGTEEEAALLCRIDTLDELDYYKHGGILHAVLRGMAG